eukprot:6489574-Amphidinium_carterae.1
MECCVLKCKWHKDAPLASLLESRGPRLLDCPAPPDQEKSHLEWHAPPDEENTHGVMCCTTEMVVAC